MVCANAHEPGMSRKSKRTVPPKNFLVPYFAGLKLEIGNNLEGREQAGTLILTPSSRVHSGSTVGFGRFARFRGTSNQVKDAEHSAAA